MKYKFISILFICISVTLISCTDVSTNNNDNNSNNPVLQSVEILKDKGKSLNDTILGCNYDNITISESFFLDIPKYEQLGIYDVVYPNNFHEKSDTLFEHYIPKFKRDTVIENQGEHSLIQVQYTDDEYFSFITSMGGFVVGENKSLNQVLFGNNIPFTETMLVTEESDKRFQIGDKETDLNALIKSTNDFIDDFISISMYSNQIKPYALSTQVLENGKTAGTMHCRYLYKDLPIFDLQSQHNEYSKPIATLTPITCVFVDGDIVSQFATIQCFKDYREVNNLSEIIYPDKAVELVSEKLSSHMSYQLKSEELVYFPVCTENLISDETGNGYDPTDVIRLTPYWVVYFDSSWWHEIYAVVNAVTGEVDFINNK